LQQVAAAAGGAVKAIALGLALATIVVACAAVPTAQHRAVNEPPHVPQGDPHEQIEHWSADIAARHQQLGGSTVAPNVTTARMATTCERAQNDSCRQTCTLADSICEDATKICNLADQMPGDAWAKDKCDSARATCTDSQKQCCGCK
jgi:hypothetical protein